MKGLRSIGSEDVYTWNSFLLNIQQLHVGIAVKGGIGEGEGEGGRGRRKEGGEEEGGRGGGRREGEEEGGRGGGEGRGIEGQRGRCTSISVFQLYVVIQTPSYVHVHCHVCMYICTRLYLKYRKSGNFNSKHFCMFCFCFFVCVHVGALVCCCGRS